MGFENVYTQEIVVVESQEKVSNPASETDVDYVGNGMLVSRYGTQWWRFVADACHHTSSLPPSPAVSISNRQS